MNKKLRTVNLALLLCLIPLLTACTLPKSIDDVKNIFSRNTQDAAKDVKPQEESPFSRETKKTSPLGKLEEILGMKKAMECTYSYENIEGLIYTDGTNVRVKTKMQGEEELVNTNAIYTPEFLYTWKEGQTEGTKISIKNLENSMTEAAQEENASASATPPYLLDMEYSCEDKEIDQNMLIIPEEVNFVELDLSRMGKFVDDLDMCSMCNSIPLAEEKEACKTEFGCN